MGKVRFGAQKTPIISSLKEVRSPEAIIQYIDRVVEVPVPVEVVRTEYVDKISEPEIKTVYIDRIIESAPKEIEKIVYVDKIVEVPVIQKDNSVEMKELASRLDRHEDFNNQKINECKIEIKNLDNKLKKQQKMLLIYGTISAILTVLGIIIL